MRQWFDGKVMQQVSWHLRKERGAGHLDKYTGDGTVANLPPFHSLAGSETSLPAQVSKSMRAYVWKPECWLINWCWVINYWEIQMFIVCWWEHSSLLAKPNIIIRMLPGSMKSEQDKRTGVSVYDILCTHLHQGYTLRCSCLPVMVLSPLSSSGVALMNFISVDFFLRETIPFLLLQCFPVILIQFS